jgi:hypothetical protein
MDASPSAAASFPASGRRAGAALTAGFLVGGAVLLNAAFTGLGAAFDYPAVLAKPPAEVLATFGERQAVVSLWFVVLAAGAGLLAPIAIRVGRLADNRLLRLSVPVGIAAAVVQVIGLLRWPLVVPFLAASSDPAAVTTFATLNLVLGTLIGETLGYALTAAWTALVSFGLRGTLFGPWLTWLGVASAVLIVTGDLVPLKVPGTALTNFAGYVLWSVWLVAFAVKVLRDRRRG